MPSNLSLYDYRWSLKISEEDPPFYGLLAAIIRKADTENLARLRAMWPKEVADLERRYHAPGGVLPEDGPNAD